MLQGKQGEQVWSWARSAALLQDARKFQWDVCITSTVFTAPNEAVSRVEAGPKHAGRAQPAQRAATCLVLRVPSRDTSMSAS